MLDDPRACDFDPAALTCRAGQDEGSCLTPKQVQAVKDIWRGPVDAAGEVIYPGLVPGGRGRPRRLATLGHRNPTGTGARTIWPRTAS